MPCCAPCFSEPNTHKTSSTHRSCAFTDAATHRALPPRPCKKQGCRETKAPATPSAGVSLGCTEFSACAEQHHGPYTTQRVWYTAMHTGTPQLSNQPYQHKAPTAQSLAIRACAYVLKPPSSNRMPATRAEALVCRLCARQLHT